MTALRGQYPNVITDGILSVWDGAAAGMDTDGGRWQLVCESHGTIASYDRLRDARADGQAGHVDFCEECMAMAVPA